MKLLSENREQQQCRQRKIKWQKLSGNEEKSCIAKEKMITRKLNRQKGVGGGGVKKKEAEKFLKHKIQRDPAFKKVDFKKVRHCFAEKKSHLIRKCSV